MRSGFAAAAINRLQPQDRSAHDWYRFVLSFPPHLVREYLDRFQVNEASVVLDPFCGTGTTLVECKKLGIRTVGMEANPVAVFASRVKTNWQVDPQRLLDHASRIADEACSQLETQGYVSDPHLCLERRETYGLRSLPAEMGKLLLSGSISPIPLHKTLVLLDSIDRHSEFDLDGHVKLALARALVNRIGNLQFGPEVGVGPAKSDADVVGIWLGYVRAMADDLCSLQALHSCPATVHRGDSRAPSRALTPGSVDVVITSPPYPNEKDYTRTTRLESVLLGLTKNKAELREQKKTLVRSNTRGVYKDDDDDKLIAGNSEIQRIAEEIETRRITLGKTSGFERLYGRVTKLYFGGMVRHLSELRTVLKPNAHLAYVVGDQASYLRIMIRTGHLLSDLAAGLGYEVIGLDLFRTRLATATREQLREEVLVLRWPGE